MNAKVAPKNLPCLFESLTNEYRQKSVSKMWDKRKPKMAACIS